MFDFVAAAPQVIVHKLLRENMSDSLKEDSLAELCLETKDVPSDTDADSLMSNTRYIKQVWSFLSENPDCKKILEAGAAEYLDKFNLALATTPRGIFCFGVAGWEIDTARASIDEVFECVPTSLLDHVNDFLRGKRTELRQSNVELHQQAQQSIEEALSSVMSSCHTEEKTGDISENFQRKVAGYLENKDGNDQYALPPINSMEEELVANAGLDPDRMQKLQEHGPRQEIVLVASLVDKAPNLGGLARTCEVFQAAALVVNDIRIVKDSVFKSLSMTAEMWVPIMEVQEKDLEHYLKRKRGFQFPQKECSVVGS